ncbi:unnamed protein product [Cylindrotheca closterium]|uniref:Uncharacterized protein n=1 Tax=Cylindrotheca closterium TaxID=2856 RepID=A0AAD2G768_9STRA|nr:unnamed protein product [Cylindrotheca closterium]
MGQGQSTGEKSEDVSIYPEDIQMAHHKIVAMREKLAVLKAQGKVNKKKRKKEIKVLSREKMDLHVTLMKLGKHAQRHYSFWEYVRIIRSTFNSTAAPLQIEGSTMTLNKDSVKKEVPKSREMVKQSDAVQYTIFAFYEAYLLKKLHIAMMLKTQKKLHAKGWNDMVMFLYYEIPKIQTSFEKAEAKIMNLQTDEEAHKAHVEQIYKSHIENQKNLMMALQEGVEGKVRAAPEGTQFSFKKKKPESTVGSNRSLTASASSSRSVESEGSSGSFKHKAARSSMFGPAYEAGSIKKEAYQAPWMKNSRNKIAKVVQKTQTPEEEAATEKTKSAAPAPAPTPAAFNRKAKFQSKFKKFEAPKEEEEEKPVVKEPEPEPVKDDEKPSSDKSPDETEATTEAEEETVSVKKKKKKLPKGMPETLEIGTGSGDEVALEEGESIKKKKKKKKKKVGTTDSEDEGLEDGGEAIVKKKKKKKKKVGESSNSSVVSELSNGSHLPH